MRLVTVAQRLCTPLQLMPEPQHERSTGHRRGDQQTGITRAISGIGDSQKTRPE
jgi:hypothetical protein